MQEELLELSVKKANSPLVRGEPRELVELQELNEVIDSKLDHYGPL